MSGLASCANFRTSAIPAPIRHLDQNLCWKVASIPKVYVSGGFHRRAVIWSLFAEFERGCMGVPAMDASSRLVAASERMTLPIGLVKLPDPSGPRMTGFLTGVCLRRIPGPEGEASSPPQMLAYGCQQSNLGQQPGNAPMQKYCNCPARRPGVNTTGEGPDVGSRDELLRFMRHMALQGRLCGFRHSAVATVRRRPGCL